MASDESNQIATAQPGRLTRPALVNASDYIITRHTQTMHATVHIVTPQSCTTDKPCHPRHGSEQRRPTMPYTLCGSVAGWTRRQRSVIHSVARCSFPGCVGVGQGMRSCSLPAPRSAHGAADKTTQHQSAHAERRYKPRHVHHDRRTNPRHTTTDDKPAPCSASRHRRQAETSQRDDATRDIPSRDITGRDPRHDTTRQPSTSAYQPTRLSAIPAAQHAARDHPSLATPEQHGRLDVPCLVFRLALSGQAFPTCQNQPRPTDLSDLATSVHSVRQDDAAHSHAYDLTTLRASNHD